MEGPKGEFWNPNSHVVLGNRKAVADLTHHYAVQRCWILSAGWWGGQATALPTIVLAQLAGVGLGWSLGLAVFVSSLAHVAARGIMAYRFARGLPVAVPLTSPRVRPRWSDGHQLKAGGGTPTPPQGGSGVQPSAETRARTDLMKAQAAALRS